MPVSAGRPDVPPGAQYLSETEADLTYVRLFNVLDYGADGGGGVDCSDAVDDALAAAYASGGGIVYFPQGTYRINSQVVIPTDGDATPVQPPITLRGEGAVWDGQWQANGDNLTGGTVLDLRATTSPAKIDARGSGTLTIENLTLTQKGSAADTTPFIRTTNTTLFVRDCSFFGHSTLTRRTCVQDAIILGAAYETVGATGATNMPFQGYGTVIERNYFARITTGVEGSTWANAVVVRDNTWSYSCGGGTGSSALLFDGTVGFNQGSIVTGNLFEQAGYDYVIHLKNSANNYIVGNSFWDGGGTYPLAMHYLSGTSTGSRDNYIQANYADADTAVDLDRCLLDETSGGPAPGTTHISNGMVRGYTGGQWRIQPPQTRIMPYDQIGNDTATVFIVSRGQQEATNGGQQLLGIAQDGYMLVGGSWASSARMAITNTAGSMTFDHNSLVKSSGSILLYAGTAASDKVVISRGSFQGPSGSTGSRPTAANAGVGAMYFDTTLGKPIWSTGSAWVLADGTGA